MLTHKIENPIIVLRLSLDLSQDDFADRLQLPRAVVSQMERGILNHLHPHVFRAFPELVERVSEYHTFRRLRRRSNWPNGHPVVPENGPEFSDFLRSLNLGLDEFCEVALLPMHDVYYAANHWRIPTQVRRFFTEINERESDKWTP